MRPNLRSPRCIFLRGDFFFRVFMFFARRLRYSTCDRHPLELGATSFFKRRYLILVMIDFFKERD